MTITKRCSRVLLLFVPFGMMLAAIVPLEPYVGTKFGVSMPRSWAVSEDAANSMIVARQDASREDSAAVLFMVKAEDPGISEEQLLDRVANQFAKNLTINKREAIRGGGHLMAADATVGGNRVRIGVIALVTGGASFVSLLVSKPGDFDALGGTELPARILRSLKALNAPAPQTSAPPGTRRGPIAGPDGKLDVQPPARPLTFADLAGEWTNDDSVMTHYANYRGDYSGSEAISTHEKWIFDGRGGIASAFTANLAGRTAARQVNEKKSGTVTFSRGVVMTLGWNGAATASYVIRGWSEIPGATVLVVNGPWYGDVPANVVGNLGIGKNLNSTWVRTAKP